MAASNAFAAAAAATQTTPNKRTSSSLLSDSNQFLAFDQFTNKNLPSNAALTTSLTTTSTRALSKI